MISKLFFEYSVLIIEQVDSLKQDIKNNKKGAVKTESNLCLGANIDSALNLSKTFIFLAS